MFRPRSNSFPKSKTEKKFEDQLKLTPYEICKIKYAMYDRVFCVKTGNAFNITLIIRDLRDPSQILGNVLPKRYLYYNRQYAVYVGTPDMTEVALSVSSSGSGSSITTSFGEGDFFA